MFEKASEIRAAQRAKMQERWTRVGREKGLAEGREKARKEARKEVASRMQEAYERFGIELDGVLTLPNTPEVEEFLFPTDDPDATSISLEVT